eukprot:TRINITY_DN5534_c0_g1_i3.p1 TRINITY_DN5534_c0_g1~~TRINITY_DN5534_c0_g1_i3.p1  ORF type:complete len:129 (+),score=27.16 TRINITY_DN5534_c0_g1_i3:55-441(+)
MHERYHEGEALHSENDVEANSAHTRLNPAARIGVIHSFPLALQNLVKKTVIVMLIQSIFCVLASFAGYAIFAIVFFLLILIGLWGVLSFRKAPTIAVSSHFLQTKTKFMFFLMIFDILASKIIVFGMN